MSEMCRLCANTGQLAAFFLIEEPDRPVTTAVIQKVVPYRESSDITRQNPDWTRVFYRCSCATGERGPNGLPRWNPEKYVAVQGILGEPEL